MNSALLEMRSIAKRFGEVVVLDGVDFDVHAGEVHALVGENGAGKSTLMRIATGIHAPDEGWITFGGRDFAPRSPAAALRVGVAMAHQELSLAPGLTIGENILAGLEPRWGWFIDWRELYDRAAELLAEFCPTLDVYAPVSSLGLGYRQIVEIVKALAWQPKVIIFDEPTSSLESHETELVLETVGKLKAKSVGVVYISHRMDEVFRISDRITVLRDGARVRSWQSLEVSRAEILRAMVGREPSQLYPARGQQPGEVLLSVEQLSRQHHFHQINFALRRGEILGFCGLVGSGRTALMRAIFGADPLDSGTILFEGEARRFRSIQEAVQAGVAYLPKDRKTQGLFLDQSVEDNIICGNLKRCSTAGIVRRRLCRQLAEEYRSQLKITTGDWHQEIRNLSGGNQQKALLARWLATSPKVLIVDEPTRGIDIEAKAEIHRLLRDYVGAGRGVILVSSEMPELLGLCDRILVLHEGRMAGEVDGRTATEQDLIHLATGSALTNC